VADCRFGPDSGAGEALRSPKATKPAGLFPRRAEMALARCSTAVTLGEFGPGNADAWQRRLLVARAGADRLHLPETGALPIDLLHDECEEPRVRRQGVHEDDWVLDSGTKALERVR